MKAVDRVIVTVQFVVYHREWEMGCCKERLRPANEP
jgi:hypothetical protein